MFGRKTKFEKEFSEGKWITWGLMAVPKEDVLSGKQQLGYTDPTTGVTKIFTPEELGANANDDK